MSSVINESTAPFWQKLANDLAPNKPSPGKTVRIVGGRKYKGREGVVERHQRGRFTDAYRYGSDANFHMRDMEGRYGWVCLVRPNEGGSPFWVDARHTEIIP